MYGVLAICVQPLGLVWVVHMLLMLDIKTAFEEVPKLDKQCADAEYEVTTGRQAGRIKEES